MVLPQKKAPGGRLFFWVTPDVIVRVFAKLLYDFLHISHIGAQFTADCFNRVIADSRIDRYELHVINSVVLCVQTFSDYISIDVLHKVCEQRFAGVVKQIAAILRGV